MIAATTGRRVSRGVACHTATDDGLDLGPPPRAALTIAANARAVPGGQIYACKGGRFYWSADSGRVTKLTERKT